MLSRAIARMALVTTIELKIRLPRAVEQLLDVFKDIAWRSTDVVHLNTAWPVMGGMKGKSGYGKNNEMEDLLRQWQALEVQDKALQTANEVQALKFIVEAASP